jgi:hypothetical protein
MQPGGFSVVTQSAEPTKHYQQVMRPTLVPAPETRLKRLWRKLLRRPEPMVAVERPTLVEIIPQDPPQAVRGHVALMGKQ